MVSHTGHSQSTWTTLSHSSPHNQSCSWIPNPLPLKFYFLTKRLVQNQFNFKPSLKSLCSLYHNASSTLSRNKFELQSSASISDCLDLRNYSYNSLITFLQVFLCLPLHGFTFHSRSRSNLARIPYFRDQTQQQLIISSHNFLQPLIEGGIYCRMPKRKAINLAVWQSNLS